MFTCHEELQAPPHRSFGCPLETWVLRWEIHSLSEAEGKDLIQGPAGGLLTEPKGMC